MSNHDVFFLFFSLSFFNILFFLFFVFFFFFLFWFVVGGGGGGGGAAATPQGSSPSSHLIIIKKQISYCSAACTAPCGYAKFLNRGGIIHDARGGLREARIENYPGVYFIKFRTQISDSETNRRRQSALI